jgi:predicted nucleic-acid-binding protein
VRIPQWIEENSDKIIKIASDAGFISEQAPQEKKPDCLAILGATGIEMKKRITYVKHLIDNHSFTPKYIFLLTGERYSLQDCNSYDQNSKCFISQDGGMDYITILAKNNHVTAEEITEIHIMKDQYKKIIGLPTPIVINTPRGIKQRPDTSDTVIHFMNSSVYPFCNRTIFVSRAPNIKAQHVAIEKVYHKLDSTKTFETIGREASIRELTHQASVAHHIIMPIAGTIYGQYVKVCKKISINQNKCTERYLAQNLSYTSLTQKAELNSRQLETPKEDL